MRSRTTIAALLTVVLVTACAEGPESEASDADTADLFSPADFAADNQDLGECQPLLPVQVADARWHAVVPGTRIPLPSRFAADASNEEVQRWSDGSYASVEVWHTPEPAEGMAMSGPATPVGDITQCGLRVAGSFAKKYALAFTAPDEPDTTYLALMHVYPREGLAFNITIETRQKALRDSLVAFASQFALQN